MMNPISRTNWVIILFVALSTACSKPGSEPAEATIDTPNKLVNISLGGKVTDDKQLPVSSAIVRTGNAVTETDQNGNFRFSNLIVRKGEAALLEVQKGGFFREYKAIEVPVSTDHFATLRLQPLSEFKLFSSYLGAQFKLTTGATIVLPANGIAEKPGGRPYDGNARVDAYSTNVDDESFTSNIPGTKAIKENKDETQLEPMAIIFTEMNGASGQPLQIEKKSTATIIFPIPASRLQSAPENIALWHFDEQSGKWSEKGTAVREGAVYKGVVSNLSTWAIGKSTE